MGQNNNPFFIVEYPTSQKHINNFIFVSCPMEVYDYSPQLTGNQLSNTANSLHKGKLWKDS